MPLLLQAYETWLYEKQYKAAMEDLYSDTTITTTETISEENLSVARVFLNKIMRAISTPRYELAMNIITILNAFTVFFRTLQQSSTEAQIHGWILLELTINYLMLLEAIGDISVSGPIKAFRYHFRIWPETLCQLMNIPATVRFI